MWSSWRAARQGTVARTEPAHLGWSRSWWPRLLVAETLRFAAHPTFCPTKSTRLRRVTSGAIQKNSGPSRKNDSASSGRPAAIEWAVAIQPMIMGASEAKASPTANVAPTAVPRIWVGKISAVRSEEHTSELQSLRHLVCRLLLE